MEELRRSRSARILTLDGRFLRDRRELARLTGDLALLQRSGQELDDVFLDFAPLLLGSLLAWARVGFSRVSIGSSDRYTSLSALSWFASSNALSLARPVRPPRRIKGARESLRTIEPIAFGAGSLPNWWITEIRYWFSLKSVMPCCANLQPKNFSRPSSL